MVMNCDWTLSSNGLWAKWFDSLFILSEINKHNNVQGVNNSEKTRKDIVPFCIIVRDR